MMPSLRPNSRPLSLLRGFLTGEASGGLILMASAAAALLVANSPLSDAYFAALKAYVGPLSVLHWINDGLMSVFFLLVGLEIKREMLDGRLRSWPDRTLPAVAALGGMVVPALVYVGINWASPSTLRGWAIPSATDIAFALGVLALLGSRVPVSLKIFLTALAIIDDLGAVIIIALFYTDNLSPWMLVAATAILCILYGLNKAGVRRLWLYLFFGSALWALVLKSGVHATIAGVLLALTVPLRLSAGKPDNPTSPLHLLEHAIHPWSAYLVLPIFGFANAGVSFAGVTLDLLLEPVTLGIALGLFLGKQLGVFGMVLAAVKLGWTKRPSQASWLQIYGVSILCGVGFTMSLFIGLLAFAGRSELENETKIGVLIGSLICMVFGATVMLIPAKTTRET